MDNPRCFLQILSTSFTLCLQLLEFLMELIERTFSWFSLDWEKKKKVMKISSIRKHHPFQLGNTFSRWYWYYFSTQECGKSFMPYCLLYSPIWFLFGFVFFVYVCIFVNIFEGVIFAEIQLAESTVCSWSSCSSVFSVLMSQIYSFMSAINQINKQCLFNSAMVETVSKYIWKLVFLTELSQQNSKWPCVCLALHTFSRQICFTFQSTDCLSFVW